MSALSLIILEWINVMIGLQFAYTSYKTLTDTELSTRIGTGLFWLLLSVIFIFGSYMPAELTGALICGLAVLTLTKQVKLGRTHTPSEAEGEQRAQKIGSWIFLPVILMALTALLLGLIFPDISAVVLGFGALVGTIVILVITKQSPRSLLSESNRMVQQVSTTGILPQVLAALGGIFAAAGVGEVISQMIRGIVPEGSLLFGVIAYVLGMVIFTMIMGNAFAAFTVITAGIGLPFVFSQGGDPFIAGALAMTAGYSGTLLTPMAGNFNALPAALLEMKNEYSVIRAQIPVALIMIVVHIVLMYFLAF